MSQKTKEEEEKEKQEWAYHVKNCKFYMVCVFCDRPIPEKRLMNGACQECDNDMCGSQHHE